MSTGESSVAQGPLTCVVVTPEMTVLETKADFLVLPLFYVSRYPKCSVAQELEVDDILPLLPLRFF